MESAEITVTFANTEETGLRRAGHGTKGEVRTLSLRFKVAALGSATALAISLGIGLASPALAVNGKLMYVDSDNTAYFVYAPTDSVGTYLQASDDAGRTQFDVPTGTGEISTYSTNPHLCMQINGSNNRIQLATCSGGVYEEWTAHSLNGGYWFYNSALNLCLNAHWQVSQLNAAPCNQGVNETFILD
jgi:hypothetical protein